MQIVQLGVPVGCINMTRTFANIWGSLPGSHPHKHKYDHWEFGFGLFMNKQQAAKVVYEGPYMSTFFYLFFYLHKWFKTA